MDDVQAGFPNRHPQTGEIGKLIDCGTAESRKELLRRVSLPEPLAIQDDGCQGSADLQRSRETAVHVRRRHVDHRAEAAANRCGVAYLKSRGQITGSPA